MSVALHVCVPLLTFKLGEANIRSMNALVFRSPRQPPAVRFSWLRKDPSCAYTVRRA